VVVISGLHTRLAASRRRRNIEASATIMRGDAEPTRKMLDTLVSDGI
jgi:hypothetical protein